GGRVSYAVAQHFKLVAEAGHMQKRPDGADTQQLTKFTFAPTWSTGPRFWDRPELRLYVTFARWNDAANAAAGPRGLTGLADGATRGTSWGVLFETWF
ncbi:MAG TPA: carbohydrate porin, partial [Burkholderiaceae bacterium]|nr:carbohydrate porin [Burkholderiaceae bacterium]